MWIAHFAVKKGLEKRNLVRSRESENVLLIEFDPRGVLRSDPRFQSHHPSAMMESNGSIDYQPCQCQGFLQPLSGPSTSNSGIGSNANGSSSSTSNSNSSSSNHGGSGSHAIAGSGMANGSSLVNTPLPHYCRVCNIQLNSCRQAKIHSSGKKHHKRLQCIQQCWEKSQKVEQTPTYRLQENSSNIMGSPMGFISSPPPNPQMFPTYNHPYPGGAFGTTPNFVPGAGLMPYPSANLPVTTSCPSVIPGAHPLPGYAPHPFFGYLPIPTQPNVDMAPVPMAMNPDVLNHHHMMASCPTGHNNPGFFMNHGSCAGGANSGAESNRSFGDTSSLMSSASYSSSSLHPGSKYPQYLARGRENIHGRGSYGSGRNSLGRPGHNQYNWMSSSHQSLYINPKSEERVNNGTTTTNNNNNNNNHHGSNMRIAQVPRKSNQDPPDSGVLSNTPIRCEVCAVSVNSSNQLQAHLTGQKHRVRAVRRGLKTSQAKASPSSSTLTSSGSESEAGGGYNPRTRRLSSDIHQMKAPSGHSTRHRSLTFGGVRSGLSRHLSSSCLSNTRNSHPSRPYFSLRKAFSQITLSKSRSLSLLLQDSRRDQDSSWSYESQEESSLSEEDDYEREERQHDIRVQEESEGEELNPIEPSIALAPKDLSSDEGACQVDPKWIIKGEPRLKDSEILDNPEYQKLTHKQSSKKGTLLRKGSSKINNNNNNNSNNSDGRPKNTCFVAAKSSLREIPMLNMFLQRLHSPQTRGTYTAHSTPSHMRNANLLSSKLAGRSGNFSLKKLNLTSPDTVLKEHTSLESDGMEASQS